MPPKGMTGTGKITGDRWKPDPIVKRLREEFIKTDCSVRSLSREANADKPYAANLPTYDYLLDISKGENWVNLRELYKSEGIVFDPDSIESTEEQKQYLACKASAIEGYIDRQAKTSIETIHERTAEVVRASHDIIDVLEVIKRQVKLASAVQGACAILVNKLMPTIKTIEEEDLQNLRPSEKIRLLSEVMKIAQSASQVERSALGIENPLVNIQNNLSIDLGVDVTKLSEEELKRLARSQEGI